VYCLSDVSSCCAVTGRNSYTRFSTELLWIPVDAKNRQRKIKRNNPSAPLYCLSRAYSHISLCYYLWQYYNVLFRRFIMFRIFFFVRLSSWAFVFIFRSTTIKEIPLYTRIQQPVVWDLEKCRLFSLHVHSRAGN